MRVEQYVMAYGVEQDRLRAILPDGYRSLRPVLRINAEIRDGTVGYIEFNTAVEKNGKKGWLNIAYWDDVPFVRSGKRVTFTAPFLEISFVGIGIEGSCPSGKDNVGCYFVGKSTVLRPPECINSNKEFCDCEFRWKFSDTASHGVSIGKTLPAYPTEVKKVYPRKSFTAENAADIPCEQVLGAYTVTFDRTIPNTEEMR